MNSAKQLGMQGRELDVVMILNFNHSVVFLVLLLFFCLHTMDYAVVDA